uniref:U3 small nucleolar RNA-associated protein 6 homolog C-terminal domain-containing protein n=1 Tax=Salarias fasciatus TaxID=181472 RepID=A0A672GDW7_SALFA
MAEIVQQRIEDRIPELEQLERVGLFTQKEVNWKGHLIAHIHYKFKREEIEFPIIERINSIFRRATKKWKDDAQLWLSHVAFCKRWGTKAQISKVFSAMLAIHPDKPAFWIMAAKSELEDRNSSESARHLFLRALRFHPDNKKVYQEYFRMELLHSEKLRLQKAELDKAQVDLVSGEYEFSTEILNGKLAEVVYRDATGKIKEAEFVIALLNVAAIFDFTKELQDMILQDLLANYTSDSVTWDFMARRELDAPTAGEELHTARGRASDVNRREERCCQVYEEGVKSLDTEPMWSRYVAFCLERVKRKTNVEELCCRCDQLQILLSLGDAEGAAGVAMAATQRFSQSLPLWSLSLQTLVQLGSGDVGRLFQDAFTHVNPKSLPLWQLQLQWSADNQSPEETEAVFQRGLLSAVAAVAMEIKERYLDWSYSTGGYKKARKIFTSLQENRPLSKAFFTKMIEIEKEQETPKMNNLRDYYERALQEFGTSDEDLWLQYIQEELGPLGQPQHCAKIHWRAMKFLEGESVERFTSKYTLIQTGHS